MCAGCAALILVLSLAGIARAAQCYVWGYTHTIGFDGLTQPDLTPPQTVPRYLRLAESTDRNVRVDAEDLLVPSLANTTFVGRVAIRARGEVFVIGIDGQMLRRTRKGFTWQTASAGTYNGVIVTASGNEYILSYKTVGTEADAFSVAVTINQAATTKYLNIKTTLDKNNLGEPTALCRGDRTTTLTLPTSHFDPAYEPSEVAVVIGSPTPLRPDRASQLVWNVEVTNLSGANTGGTLSFSELPAEITGLGWTCTASGAATCGAASGLTASPPAFELPLGSAVRIGVVGLLTETAETQTLTASALVGGDVNPANNTDTMPLGGRWRVDQDGDGYGAPNSFAFLKLSELLPGDETVGGDCNDGNKSIHPGAQESCNGLDDNCNAATDEGRDCPVVDAGGPEVNDDAGEQPDAGAPDAGTLDASTDVPADTASDTSDAAVVDAHPDAVAPPIDAPPATDAALDASRSGADGAGCGCSTAPRSASPSVLLLAGLVLRRRRQSRASRS